MSVMTPKKGMGYPEFVALMALLMSLVALGIDTMLPALVTIGSELGVSNPNHNQYVVSVFFFDLALGQLLYGPLSASRVLRAIRQVCAIRATLGYRLAAGFISGLFLAFLSTSPQILQVQYQLGASFPLFFALIALSIGLAFILNGRLVMRLGMQLLSRRALWAFLGLTALYSVPAFTYAGQPPLWSFIGYLMSALFCIGILFGNLNALAMQPLGNLAGVGAAVVGVLGTLISLPLGILIGHCYDGTVLPLLAGFGSCSLAAILLMAWTENV